MMRLEIRNFYTIRAAEIEFADTTVFIGAQAAGKSLIAKVFYFVNQIIPELFFSNDHDEAMREAWKKFQTIFNQSTLEKNFELVCTGIADTDEDDDYIKIDCSGITLGDIVKGHLETLHIGMACHLLLKKIYIEKGTEENFSILSIANYLLQEIKHDLCFKFEKNEDDIIDALNNYSASKTLFSGRKDSLYIPAGRAFISVLRESAFSLLEGSSLDYFLKQFGVAFEKALKAHSKESIRLDEAAQNLTKGDFYSRDGECGLLDDGRSTPIHACSSGQQELMPLLLTLNMFCNENVDNSRNVVIEEPETHLFPKSQYELVKYLYTKKQHHPLRFVITTHSPYILSAINNLILAGQVVSENPEQVGKTENILRCNCTIEPDSVRAYEVTSDGLVRDIFDAENKIISADAIDDASKDIYDDFDSLLELLPVEGEH